MGLPKQIETKINDVYLDTAEKLIALAPAGSYPPSYQIPFNTLVQNGLGHDFKAAADIMAGHFRAIGDIRQEAAEGFAEEVFGVTPADAYGRHQGEKIELEMEVDNQLVHAWFDTKAVIYEGAGNLDATMEALGQAVDHGDYKQAGELMLDIAGGLGLDVLKVGGVGVKTVWDVGSEYAEGASEITGSYFDALTGSGDLSEISMPQGTGAGQGQGDTGASTGLDESLGTSGITPTVDATQEREMLYEGSIAPADDFIKDDTSGNGDDIEPADDDDWDEDDPFDDEELQPADDFFEEEEEDAPSATVLIPSEQEGDDSDESEVNFDDGRPIDDDGSSGSGGDSGDSGDSGSGDSGSGDSGDSGSGDSGDSGDDGSSDGSSDDSAADGSGADGYTPDDSEAQGQITAADAAAASARVSDSALKLFDESYTGSSPVGDVAQAFGQSVDDILMDLVSYPDSAEDDPQPLGEAEWTPQLTPKDLWTSGGDAHEMRGDPVPMPVDGDLPFGPFGQDHFEFG